MTYYVAWNIVALCLAIFDVAHAEVTQVTYVTSFSSGSGYYILDGEQLTLACAYTGTLTSLAWSTQNSVSQQILLVSPGSEDHLPDTEYKSRIVESTLTSTSHQMVIRVDKQQDEEQEFRCSAITQENPFGSEERIQLREILVSPSSLTFEGLNIVIEGQEQTIECDVDSVYGGEEVTEFGVKVGDSTLTSGTETQTTGSVSGTYTVKYTQTATFTYSQHQGQQVQCEVTWMGGTSVETVRTSTVKTLDVYVPAASVTLEVPDSLAIPEGSVMTLTCTTFSNPSPRLRLYRQREGQTASVIQSVTDVTLSLTYSVESDDNNAEFYCRADDNSDTEGWDFDVQSMRQQITILDETTTMVSSAITDETITLVSSTVTVSDEKTTVTSAAVQDQGTTMTLPSASLDEVTAVTGTTTPGSNADVRSITTAVLLNSLISFLIVFLLL